MSKKRPEELVLFHAKNLIKAMKKLGYTNPSPGDKFIRLISIFEHSDGKISVDEISDSGIQIKG